MLLTRLFRSSVTLFLNSGCLKFLNVSCLKWDAAYPLIVLRECLKTSLVFNICSNSNLCLCMLNVTA